MSALARNPYEESARAKKLLALLEAVDADSAEQGLDPRRDAALVLDKLTGDDFARIVRRAGVKTPGPTTVAEFMAALRHRAEVAS